MVYINSVMLLGANEAVAMPLFLFLCLCVGLPAAVLGRTDVHIDDTNSLITYSTGDWILAEPNALDEGGNHMLTERAGATARFTFTGVRIQYMAPLWPYQVGVALQLDGDTAVIRNLVDTSRPTTSGGPETVRSQVVWDSGDLTNATHTLVMSVPPGQQYSVVDTLIYTRLDPSDSQSISTTTRTTTRTTRTSSSATSSTQSSTSTSSAAEKSTSSHVLPIALGSALGFVAVAAVALSFWCLCCGRRRKEKPEKAPSEGTWTHAGSVYTSPKDDTGGYLPGSEGYPEQPGYVPGPSVHRGVGVGPRVVYTAAAAPPPMPSGQYIGEASPGVTFSTQPGQGHDSGVWAASGGADPRGSIGSRYQPATLSTITEGSPAISYSSEVPIAQLGPGAGQMRGSPRRSTPGSPGRLSSLGTGSLPESLYLSYFGAAGQGQDRGSVSETSEQGGRPRSMDQSSVSTAGVAGVGTSVGPSGNGWTQEFAKTDVGQPALLLRPSRKSEDPFERQHVRSPQPPEYRP